MRAIPTLMMAISIPTHKLHGSRLMQAPKTTTRRFAVMPFRQLKRHSHNVFWQTPSCTNSIALACHGPWLGGICTTRAQPPASSSSGPCLHTASTAGTAPAAMHSNCAACCLCLTPQCMCVCACVCERARKATTEQCSNRSKLHPHASHV